MKRRNPTPGTQSREERSGDRRVTRVSTQKDKREKIRGTHEPPPNREAEGGTLVD